MTSEGEGIMEKDGRTLKRRHLIYYLEVYDDETGDLLGHLVDLTTGGIKLISKHPIETEKAFSLRMMLPEGYFREKMLHFDGLSKWCDNDVNPEFFVTGFEVQKLEKKVRKHIVNLITWLGFND